MTDLVTTEQFQQEATDKVLLISQFTNKMLSAASGVVQQTTAHLQNIIKWDTAELSLLRELEQSVREGSATGPVSLRILGELTQLRQELAVLNGSGNKQENRSEGING